MKAPFNYMGGGALNWKKYLFHSLSAEVYFLHNLAIYLFQYVCGDIYLFHYLVYFSVYKFRSRIKPGLDLQANDQSKKELHIFKGHLKMPDKWGLDFFRTIKWCCSLAEIIIYLFN